MSEDTLKKILSELEMIRKIKMTELSERGYSQSKIGDVLGISQASVSRMMTPKKSQAVKSDENSGDR
jgi:predicted transcriptional regulator